MREDLQDDRCASCGFDASTWTRTEMIAAISNAGSLLAESLDGTDTAALNTRSQPGVWSPLEYVDHIREVFQHSRLVCEQALTRSDEPYTDPFPPTLEPVPASLDPVTTIRALEDETRRNARMFAGLEDTEWNRASIVLDRRWTLAFALTHTLHELLHHHQDIRDCIQMRGSEEEPLDLPEAGPR